MAEITTAAAACEEVCEHVNTSNDEKNDGETAEMAEKEASICFETINENCTNDELCQKIEDAIRDVCILRKTIPSKVAELVEENYASREQIFPDAVRNETDASEGRLSLDGFNAVCCQKENLSSLNSLKDDLAKLTEEYKDFARLKEIKKGIDLNLEETQEILQSEKRKRKLNYSTAEKEKANEQITRPGREKINFEMSPVVGLERLTKTPDKKQSASRIPRRKAVTPSVTTPLSTRGSKTPQTKKAVTPSTPSLKTPQRRKPVTPATPLSTRSATKQRSTRSSTKKRRPLATALGRT